jgi:hypothetical protein
VLDAAIATENTLNAITKDLSQPLSKQAADWGSFLTNVESYENLAGDVAMLLAMKRAPVTGATTATAASAGRGFSSFSSFKRAMGSAGEGKAWHHIVEQHAGNIAKFGAENIHNTNNVIKLASGKGSIHAKVTGYYNSIMEGTNMTVRDYVKTLSYDKQYEFGIKVLKRFGWQE